MAINVIQHTATLTYVSKGIYEDRSGKTHGFGHCDTCGEKFETFGLGEELSVKLVNGNVCYRDYQATLPKGNFMNLKDEILNGLTASEYQIKFGQAWNE